MGLAIGGYASLRSLAPAAEVVGLLAGKLSALGGRGATGGEPLEPGNAERVNTEVE
jgi:hypothetical protein